MATPPTGDSSLLARYVDASNEAAFAELTRRHGGMVYRVCLRLTGNTHDAEDAAQATFVVLARKAKSLKRDGSLSAWLHGVARRVSLEAIKTRRRRETSEKEASMQTQKTVVSGDEELAAAEQAALLSEVDHEINRLSPKLRQAVILRYLEGRSQEESCIIAECPQGTLADRAKRGIDTLRKRLRRPLSVGLLLALLDGEAQAAAVVSSTFLSSLSAATAVAAIGATSTGGGTVLALAQGAIKMMFWQKVATIGVFMTLTATVGIGVVAAEQIGASSTNKDQTTAKPVTNAERKAKLEACLAGAKALLKAGNLVMAEKMIGMALSIDPKSPRAQQLRLRINLGLKKPLAKDGDEAKIKLLKTEIAERKAKLEACLAEAKTLLKAGNLAMAEKMIGMALSIDPKSPRAQQLRLMINLLLKKKPDMSGAMP